ATAAGSSARGAAFVLLTCMENAGGAGTYIRGTLMARATCAISGNSAASLSTNAARVASSGVRAVAFTVRRPAQSTYYHAEMEACSSNSSSRVSSETMTFLPIAQSIHERLH